MKKMLSKILLLTALILLLSLWGFYWAIRPFRITSAITPKAFNVAYENISFRTQDNILLKGWFILSKKPKAKTIIFLHGYPADKGNILPAMIYLHPYYNLLFFDFRYFGESEGHYSTVGKNEVLDLLAAINYLHSRGIHEVGVWGFSLGAAVALMTAPQAPEIKAIVAESSYARLDWMVHDYYPIPFLRYFFGELTRLWAWMFFHISIKDVSPADAAKKIMIPVLLIHSEQDTMIPYKHALLLQESLKDNPNASTIIIKDLQHGGIMQNHEVIVKDFFDKYLGLVDVSTKAKG